MTSKRVLFVTYGFSVGGAERFTVNLLNSLDRGRINPLVVSLNGPGELEALLHKDIEVLHFQRKGRFDFSPVKDIARVLNEFDIDTIFVLSTYCNMFVRVALRQVKRPIRVIISVHSTSPRSAKDAVLSLLYARFLTGKETISAVSSHQATYLSRHFFIHQKQFVMIHNGVDASRWTLAPESFDWRGERQRLGLPVDAIVIVMIAALRPEKRHEDAILALAYWKSTFKENLPHIVFVGGGNLQRQHDLEALASTAGVAANVKFFGIQSDPRPFYWVADLFTLSSVAVETFSMAALEAMASGLPSVLTDIGGATEMITQGVNGFIVPCRDPRRLAEGWRKVALKNLTLTAEGIRDFAREHFSLEESVRRYEALLLDGVVSVTVDS